MEWDKPVKRPLELEQEKLGGGFGRSDRAFCHSGTPESVHKEHDSRLWDTLQQPLGHTPIIGG